MVHIASRQSFRGAFYHDDHRFQNISASPRSSRFGDTPVYKPLPCSIDDGMREMNAPSSAHFHMILENIVS